jgi:hypothetical protein
VLTSDEILDRLEAQQKERRTRSRRNKRGSEKARQGKKKIEEDKNHCQLCAAEFKDGEEDSCLGSNKVLAVGTLLLHRV